MVPACFIIRLVQIRIRLAQFKPSSSVFFDQSKFCLRTPSWSCPLARPPAPPSSPCWALSCTFLHHTPTDTLRLCPLHCIACQHVWSKLVTCLPMATQEITTSNLINENVNTYTFSFYLSHWIFALFIEYKHCWHLDQYLKICTFAKLVIPRT